MKRTCARTSRLVTGYAGRESMVVGGIPIMTRETYIKPLDTMFIKTRWLLANMLWLYWAPWNWPVWVALWA